MKSNRSVFAAAAVLAGALCAPGAQAAIGSFNCITGNSPASCSYAEATLSWAFDGSFFSIANTGTGYVSEVYFDTMPGVTITFFGGEGTLFTAGAKPPNLPGGNEVSFTSDFAFDSDGGKGKPVNGINTGETATFRITGAAEGDIAAGELFAGVHVRSVLNGESESLVTVATPVPEPEAYALMLVGLGVVGWAARRRRAA